MSGGFFENLFRRRRQYSEDGSSRRGRRYWDRGDDYSVGKDSSTHSALFDLELSTRGPRALLELERHANVTAHASAELHTKLQRVTYLARPTAGFEVDLLHQVQAIRGDCCTTDGELDLMRLALSLCILGYACSIQCNDPTLLPDSQPGTSQGTHGSAVDGTCLEKLRHTFIVCSGRSDGSITHYCLVDPQFRDQFRIGQPTPAYETVLGVLPPEFVGSPLRLQALADVLCTEIVDVYREQNLPLPPWRKSQAMLSKWFDVSSPQQAPPMLPLPRTQAPGPPHGAVADPFVVVSGGSTSAGGVHPPGVAPISIRAAAATLDDVALLSRARSGGWSDLATIQETPSPHHPYGSSERLAGSSDRLAGSFGAHSGGSSESGRQPVGGKVVSLLAKGLSGLKMKGGKKVETKEQSVSGRHRRQR